MWGAHIYGLLCVLSIVLILGVVCRFEYIQMV